MEKTTDIVATILITQTELNEMVLILRLFPGYDGLSRKELQKKILTGLETKKPSVLRLLGRVWEAKLF